MDIILYLDDFINIYIKKEDKIIRYKPYKNTIKNGRIINRIKFIKIFNKIKDNYNLNNNFLNASILIIINKNIEEEDKKVFLEVFDELNYKNIKFNQELNYLKMNKNTVYINYNYSYFYIYNVDDLGKVNINIYSLNKLNKKIVIELIRYFSKKKIYIYGKNYQELINIINKNNFNYYYFEESEDLIIKLSCSKNVVK